ncbi:hypothetical protein CRENPOLYSF2_3590011 [Crenothrix polyspora]|uniref:Uncharacterized protein n=1 Tax=Crenothrix polyspora TaxID=360316 RepID=A0A1R4HD09_9GAMM|nr:hypothetical protein CRENPOLYSF2_3590011 [Crenothrix polyspora]
MKHRKLRRIPSLVSRGPLGHATSRKKNENFRSVFRKAAQWF